MSWKLEPRVTSRCAVTQLHTCRPARPSPCPPGFSWMLSEIPPGNDFCFPQVAYHLYLPPLLMNVT
mgnify:CR=1 FL=1